MYRINFYVPGSHLEQVKKAMFDAGAGKLGHYDNCCWQVEGQGQFRPLSGSDSHLGEVDELCVVKEFKVEMICQDESIKDALKALLSNHPYETPAYDVMQMLDTPLD